MAVPAAFENYTGGVFHDTTGDASSSGGSGPQEQTILGGQEISTVVNPCG